MMICRPKRKFMNNSFYVKRKSISSCFFQAYLEMSSQTTNANQTLHKRPLATHRIQCWTQICVKRPYWFKSMSVKSRVNCRPNKRVFAPRLKECFRRDELSWVGHCHGIQRRTNAIVQQWVTDGWLWMKVRLK